MFCRNCGAKLSDDTHSCPECGAEVVLPNQGEDIPALNGKPGKPGSSGGRSRLLVFIISVVVIIVLVAMVAVFTQGFVGFPHSGTKTGGDPDLRGVYSTTQPTGIPPAATPV